MGKSVCCNAKTKIGYYNASKRPDIHGAIHDNMIAVGVLGTYCKKCGELCDFIIKGVEYYTNGIKKQ
jgi:hypothetical protein